MSTVLVISLAAGIILVVGGGIMMYMANLVRSAYEIKVQMKAEIDDRLTKMGEDLDKRSKWIQRELVEEIDKVKIALQADNARKMSELADPLLKKFEEYDQLLRNERAEWVKAVESDRQNITALDAKIRGLKREMKHETDAAGSALDAATAQLATKPADAPKAAPPSPPE